jgi:hypothetical protein
MGGVDKSDQMLKYYEVLRKSLKYWKKLFLHFIDVAVLNSYIIFQKLRKEHPEKEELKRLAKYGHKEFRLELACALGGITESSTVPLYNPPPPPPLPPIINPRHASYASHLPRHIHDRRRRVVCQVKSPKALTRSRFECQTCEVALCLTEDRNCFDVYHSWQFDEYIQ